MRLLIVAAILVTTGSALADVQQPNDVVYHVDEAPAAHRHSSELSYAAGREQAALESAQA